MSDLTSVFGHESELRLDDGALGSYFLKFWVWAYGLPDNTTLASGGKHLYHLRRRMTGGCGQPRVLLSPNGAQE